MSLIEKAKNQIEYRKKLFEILTEHRESIINEDTSEAMSAISSLNSDYYGEGIEICNPEIVNWLNGEAYYEGSYC